MSNGDYITWSFHNSWWLFLAVLIFLPVHYTSLAGWRYSVLDFWSLGRWFEPTDCRPAYSAQWAQTRSRQHILIAFSCTLLSCPINSHNHGDPSLFLEIVNDQYNDHRSGRQPTKSRSHNIQAWHIFLYLFMQCNYSQWWSVQCVVETSLCVVMKSLCGVSMSL